MIPAPKQQSHPVLKAPVFQSCFESFLGTKDIKLLDTLKQPAPLPNNNNESHSEPPVKKKRGRKPVIEEKLEDLTNGVQLMETGPNKWSQTCENCPSLVHLMFNHLNEIAAGRRNPIQYGMPSHEIIEHLSEALGYNERQIQRMITMGKKPYRCRICIEAYETKVELQQHISEQHADVKTVPCMDCDKMFHSKDNLRAHMQTAHKPKEHKEFPCPIENCAKEYASLKMLERHLKNVHNGEQQFTNLDYSGLQEQFEQTLEYQPTVNQSRGRGRPRGSSNAARGTTTTVTRGRGGKRGRPAKPKVLMETDESSGEALPEDREDDEFLVNTETEMSSEEDDEIDYFEERF